MHILQLVSRFPPVHVGGIENAVYSFSRELVRKGHEVTVLTSNDSWDRVVEEIDGIRIVRLPCLFKLGYTSPFLPSFLLESIRADPCDIVHAHIPDGFLSASSPVVSMVKSCPLVLTVHNFPLGETPSKLVLGRVLEYLLHFAFHQANSIIVHNNSCVFLPQLIGLRRKICVSPLGVDLKRFGPKIDG
ncbi:MAG: glycosyltransferase, partial [Candidatus Bathyarchaeota archaeon]